MDYGSNTRPGCVLVGIMVLAIPVIMIANSLNLFTPVDLTPGTQPMQTTPQLATPVATVDTAQLEAIAQPTVTARLEAAGIAQKDAETAKTNAEANKTAAEADKIKAEADKAQAEADRIKSEAAKKQAEADKAAAEALFKTLMAYGIIILSATVSMGVFLMVLGRVLKSLVMARQRRDEAAAERQAAEQRRVEASERRMVARRELAEAETRRLELEAKLGKNTTPLRGPEKSYQDAPTVGNPHPQEDGSTKERDRITKGQTNPHPREKQTKGLMG